MAEEIVFQTSAEEGRNENRCKFASNSHHGRHFGADDTEVVPPVPEEVGVFSPSGGATCPPTEEAPPCPLQKKVVMRTAANLLVAVALYP